MEFGLSEEQRMLQDSVTRFLSEQCDLDRVRKVAAADAPFDQEVWGGIVDLGLTSILIPEEHGGMGLSLLDAALVQEAIGGAIAPVPFTGAAVMAPLAIVAAGDDAQQAAWLPKIVSGEARIGIAVTERVSARDGAGVTSSGDKLSGTALFVLEPGTATDFLTSDQNGRLYLVGKDAPGLAQSGLMTIDKTRNVGELKLDGVAGEPLTAENDVGAACARIIDAGRIMLAADTLGAGDTMIRKAVEYAKERKQFNRVIASFQAVKHLCAEMAAELEPCRSLVWYAAHAFDHIPEESHLMACHAKAHLSEVGRFVARTSTEVHGGMGFTDLMGLHYWFKRIGADRQLLGGPELVRAEAARAQGWGSAA
jgi:alkylation response protein AidB-like acyl-CoA dehydrogenase